MYWFISYKVRRRGSSETRLFNLLLANQHPVAWLVSVNEKYVEEETYRLISFSEIEEQVYHAEVEHFPDSAL